MASRNIARRLECKRPRETPPEVLRRLRMLSKAVITNFYNDFATPLAPAIKAVKAKVEEFRSIKIAAI